MPVHERLSMVVSLILIGLALYFVIDLPPQSIVLGPLVGTNVTPSFDFQKWSIPLSISSQQVMVILLGGMALTGCGAIVRTHPQKRIAYTKPFWVNATLLVMLEAIILAQMGSPFAWGAGLVVSGGLLWVTILGTYYTVDKDGPHFNKACLWSQSLSYALLLAYAVFIYQSKMMLALKLGCLLVVGWFLAASILNLRLREGQQLKPFPFLIALGLSQIGWALHYWPISPFKMGVLSLLLFYGFCGVIRAYFEGNLSKRVLVEYILVAGIGFWVVQWV